MGLPDFLANIGCLGQQGQTSLVKDLSYEEIKNIVKKDCDHNKSPGLDGLPYEFYQVTRDIIGNDFVEVFTSTDSQDPGNQRYWG